MRNTCFDLSLQGLGNCAVYFERFSLKLNGFFLMIFASEVTMFLRSVGDEAVTKTKSTEAPYMFSVMLVKMLVLNVAGFILRLLQNLL